MASAKSNLESLIDATSQWYRIGFAANPVLWPCLWYIHWWKLMSGMSLLDGSYPPGPSRSGKDEASRLPASGSVKAP